MKKNVTIVDVAKHAGVCHATVSRAFSGNAHVKTETRERIFRAVSEMGFVANPLAKGLVGGKTNTIGILWWLGGPHQGALVADDIAIYAQKKHQYVSYVTDHLMDPEVVLKSLKDFAQRKVEGVVIQYDPDLNRPDITACLEEFDAVVLAVDHSQTALETPFDMIHRDLSTGISEAADYLIATGRRRPAVLIPALSMNAKAVPFLSRFAARGIKVSRRAVITFPLPTTNRFAEFFYQALQRNFPGPFPFDCLLCGTDEGAAMAMRFLREKGHSVPDEVAVVGFNDSEFAGCLTPPLASIARHDEALAKQAFDMLFRRLREPEIPRQRENMQMSFVWRESAGGIGGSSSREHRGRPPAPKNAGIRRCVDRQQRVTW
jgi:LacI family transcriptional regulator